MIHVGCWAHARRKFVDAVKVNPKDGAAIAMVTRMDALFLVDREARRQQLNAGQLGALRREHAQVWVDEIHAECRKLRSALLPKSTLGEAVNYTLNMWVKLRRCFDHPEVELSNIGNINSLIPVAVQNVIPRICTFGIRREKLSIPRRRNAPIAINIARAEFQI